MSINLRQPAPKTNTKDGSPDKGSSRSQAVDAAQVRKGSSKEYGWESEWESDWDTSEWESDWNSENERIGPLNDDERQVKKLKSLKILITDDDSGVGSSSGGRQTVRRRRMAEPGSPVPYFTCHSCRQKTVKKGVSCSLCPKAFCGLCLLNRNGEMIGIEAGKGLRWTCPKCRGGCGPGCKNCCICAPCRKREGLEPTGKKIGEARDAGFTNVHDYLIHCQTGESPGQIAARKNGRGWTKNGSTLESCPAADYKRTRRILKRKERQSKARKVSNPDSSCQAKRGLNPAESSCHAKRGLIPEKNCQVKRGLNPESSYQAKRGQNPESTCQAKRGLNPESTCQAKQGLNPVISFLPKKEFKPANGCQAKELTLHNGYYRGRKRMQDHRGYCARSSPVLKPTLDQIIERLANSTSPKAHQAWTDRLPNPTNSKTCQAWEDNANLTNSKTCQAWGNRLANPTNTKTCQASESSSGEENSGSTSHGTRNKHQKAAGRILSSMFRKQPDGDYVNKITIEKQVANDMSKERSTALQASKEPTQMAQGTPWSSLPPFEKVEQPSKGLVQLRKPVTSLQALRKMGVLSQHEQVGQLVKGPLVSKECSGIQQERFGNSSLPPGLGNCRQAHAKPYHEVQPPPWPSEVGLQAILTRHQEKRKKIQFRSSLKSPEKCSETLVAESNGTATEDAATWRPHPDIRQSQLQRQPPILRSCETAKASISGLSNNPAKLTGFERFSGQETATGFGSFRGEKVGYATLRA